MPSKGSASSLGRARDVTAAASRKSEVALESSKVLERAEEEEDGGSGKRMTRVEPRVRDLEGAARGRALVPGP